MRATLLMASALALVIVGAVQAAETITYTYDAKGRLIKVVHTGTAHQGATIVRDYAHDKADNRTQVKTTGAPN